MNNEKDIRPVDENGLNHGYWKVYKKNGDLYFKGNFKHGRYDTLCIYNYNYEFDNDITKVYFIR